MTSTSASQMASLALVLASRVEVTSVQLRTLASTENVSSPSTGITSCHGAALRTKSYTAAPPGMSESIHPRSSSTRTRMADRSHTFARYPTLTSPRKDTPDAPTRTSCAPMSEDSSSAATTSSRPGWHVA